MFLFTNSALLAIQTSGLHIGLICHITDRYRQRQWPRSLFQGRQPLMSPSRLYCDWCQQNIDSGIVPPGRNVTADGVSGTPTPLFLLLVCCFISIGKISKFCQVDECKTTTSSDPGELRFQIGSSDFPVIDLGTLVSLFLAWEGCSVLLPREIMKYQVIYRMWLQQSVAWAQGVLQLASYFIHCSLSSTWADTPTPLPPHFTCILCDSHVHATSWN